MSFDGNESRIFNLNATGLAILSGWFADPDSNEGFVLYGGNGRFEIGSKENSLEGYRPKLLVSYTPPEPDEDAPILTGISTVPTSPVNTTGVEQIIDIDFDSSEYPIYLTYNLYSSTGLLVGTTGEYYLADSGASIPSFTVGDTLADGIYYLEYYVRDESNNSSTGDIATIVIDSVERFLTI